jgi:hypothetical protein
MLFAPAWQGPGFDIHGHESFHSALCTNAGIAVPMARGTDY